MHDPRDGRGHPKRDAETWPRPHACKARGCGCGAPETTTVTLERDVASILRGADRLWVRVMAVASDPIRNRPATAVADRKNAFAAARSRRSLTSHPPGYRFDQWPGRDKASGPLPSHKSRPRTARLEPVVMAICSACDEITNWASCSVQGRSSPNWNRPCSNAISTPIRNSQPPPVDVPGLRLRTARRLLPVTTCRAGDHTSIPTARIRASPLLFCTTPGRKR